MSSLCTSPDGNVLHSAERHGGGGHEHGEQRANEATHLQTSAISKHRLHPHVFIDIFPSDEGASVLGYGPHKVWWQTGLEPCRCGGIPTFAHVLHLGQRPVIQTHRAHFTHVRAQPAVMTRTHQTEKHPKVDGRPHGCRTMTIRTQFIVRETQEILQLFAALLRFPLRLRRRAADMNV